MKTPCYLFAGLALAFLAGAAAASADVATDWYAQLDLAQQTSGQNAGGRARADGIVRAALAGAILGIDADHQSGRAAEPAPAGANLEAAAAQAAHDATVALYPGRISALDIQLTESLAGLDDTPSAIAAGRDWGKHVAAVVLADNETAVSVNAYTFADLAPAQVAPAPVPAAAAEAAAIGPGRYRFTTLAGASGTKGYVDGVGSAARFDNPRGIAVDAEGNVYFSEQDLCTIRKITPDGVVTTFAGAVGQRGSQDGTGTAARFNDPGDLTVDGAGNVYVADSDTIRKVSPSGSVTTIANTSGHIAVDDGGNVLVASDYNQAIDRIAPDGTISRLTIKLPTGYPGNPFWFDAVKADHAGNLYVILDDWDITAALKLTPSAAGEYVGQVIQDPAPSYWATAIGLDDAGNLYVRYDADPIYRFSPAGQVEVRYAAGSSGGFFWGSMCVDNVGRILALPEYFDYVEKVGTIEIGTFDPTATGLSITRQPSDELGVSAGSGVYFHAGAAGAASLAYQWYHDSKPIPGATNPDLYLRGVQATDAGSYYVVVTDGAASVTSRNATLTVTQASAPNPPPPAVAPTAPATPAPAGTGSANSGGGSFDLWFALPVFALLAAALRRRPAGRCWPSVSRNLHSLDL